MDLTPILLAVIIFILLYIVFSINHSEKKADNNSDMADVNLEQITAAENNTGKKTSDTSPKTNSSSKKTSTRKTSKMKWRNKMLDISMIPKGIELDRNTLLPQSIKREYGYGRRFNTFEVSQDVFFYHRSTCRDIKGIKHQVIHRYIALQRKLPCPECTPNAQIDDWYMEFLRVNFGADANYNEFASQFGLFSGSLPNANNVKSLESSNTYIVN